MRTLVRLALPLLAVTVMGSTCDPKKLDGTGGTNGATNNTTDSTVTPQALSVGNILSLQNEIVHEGVSLAAHFDSASAPAPRGILAQGCFSVTESDSALPVWAMRLDGCVDSHGTTYRGGGEFAPVDSIDGYAFFPWGEPDLIRASNDAHAEYAHDLNSGSIDFTFTRNSGTVTGVDVGKYLRHNVQNQTVTFTWDNVHYAGSAGSLADYPDAGSTVGVVWSGVGIFDITFAAGGTATYTMQGKTYSVNMTTGDVRVSSTQ